MANNAGPSRREAMRLKAQAEEARGRRNSRILWVSLAAVAVVVIVILALVITQSLGKDSPSANQQTPPNATETYGIEIKSQDVEPAADAPHLTIWEEYRCPACAQREEAFGPALDQLVDEGKITLEIGTAHFFDTQDGTDNSTRAAIAAASADAVGKFREFHSAAYTSFLATGSGYSDQQLRVDIPAMAGIEGEDLVKFQELYDGGAFADFVDDANDEFRGSGLSGTPAFVVNGNQLEFFNQETEEVLIQPTPEDLLRAINEANN